MATKEKAVAKKTAKNADKMTPLEKARLAKKNGPAAGKKVGAKSKKKKVAIIFKAPETFKPFFARVVVKIAKDGLFSDMKVTRIQGSPKNENAKTVDMAAHDPDTLRKMAARYGGAAFVTNVDKRLPANSMISFQMRVGKKSDSGALTTAFKEFKFKGKDDKKAKVLDKSDPIYRRARKPVRFMPGAFTTIFPFPTNAELKAMNVANGEPEVELKTKKRKVAPEKVVVAKKKAKKAK
jgi:hypothetical protein